MSTGLLLDALVLIPLLGAGVVLLFESEPRAARGVALVTVLLQGVALLSLAPAGIFQGERVVGSGGEGTLRFWSLAADGLSTPLLALTVLVGIVAVAASWSLQDRPVTHYALLLGLQAAVTLVFLAQDAILFYVAWEAVLVPMYFLIGGWGHERRRHAAMKFFIYTFVGSAFMLVGLLTAIFATGTYSLAGMAARAEAIPPVVYPLLLVGFLVKIPVVPLHTWLPDAHVEAPTAGSIVLAGVLLKMGGYGILRLAIPLAPASFDASRGVLLALGLLGIVWGAAMALVQDDLKRLVAYSSVSHMGFVVLAIAAASADAFGAAMVVMVSHGLVAAMQFFLVGALYERTHTRELSRLGGLARVAPVWGVAFVFSAMASLGLPGLSGFPGEFVTVLESFRAFGWWSAIACIGVVFAAAYGLRAVARSVQGTPDIVGEVRDLDAVEKLTVLTLAVLVVAVGLAPMLVLRISDQALQLLAAIAAVAR